LNLKKSGIGITVREAMTKSACDCQPETWTAQHATRHKALQNIAVKNHELRLLKQD
jgi:hypothetical protein